MNPDGTFTKTVRRDRRLAFYHHPDYSSAELETDILSGEVSGAILHWQRARPFLRPIQLIR